MVEIPFSPILRVKDKSGAYGAETPEMITGHECKRKELL
jgi:hypothetical protein